jgi:hypothetical protein
MINRSRILVGWRVVAGIVGPIGGESKSPHVVDERRSGFRRRTSRFIIALHI